MGLGRWIRQSTLLSPQKRLEWYPPFRSMGIRITEMAEDGMRLHIKLPLNGHNKNLGGGMFGGSMASLADPIPAIVCGRLFPGYSVWTRHMEIDFIKEGRTDLELRFDFDEAQRVQIAEELERRGRCTPKFEFAYYLADGVVCAKIKNTVAIRKVGYTTGAGALGQQKKEST